jgi:hypothetical protein
VSIIPTVDSLAAEIQRMQRQIRDLAVGNPLNRGAVQNASGLYVPLSSLAFGQATAVDPARLEMGTTSTGPGFLGWYSGGPYVNVLVMGGKLRVDLAAALTAQGNKCSTFVSYALLGPGPTDVPPGPGTWTTRGELLVEPAQDRAIEIQHNGSGMDQRAAMGTFGLHTGLTPGWYTVDLRYALAFSGTTGGPYGSVQNRRVAATPY